MSFRFPALVATLAALSTASAYAADEYQWEAGGMFISTTQDSTPSTKETRLAAEGTYFLAPVQLGNHPYEEASFLEHSTSVSATLFRDASKQSGGFDGDGFGLEVAGRYATKEFPVAFDLSISSEKVSDTGIDVKIFDWELRAGYWIMPDLIAGLGYDATTTKVTSKADEKDSQIFAYGKWVHELNADLDLNLEATLGQKKYDDGTTDEKNTDLTVSGDVYFQKKYGIGLNLGTESGDAKSVEGTTIGIEASAWFNTQIGVRAGYEKFSAKDTTGEDSNTFAIEVVGRF